MTNNKIKHKEKLTEYILNSLEPFSKEEVDEKLMYEILSGFETFADVHLKDDAFSQSNEVKKE